MRMCMSGCILRRRGRSASYAVCMIFLLVGICGLCARLQTCCSQTSLKKAFYIDEIVRKKDIYTRRLRFYCEWLCLWRVCFSLAHTAHSSTHRPVWLSLSGYICARFFLALPPALIFLISTIITSAAMAFQLVTIDMHSHPEVLMGVSVAAISRIKGISSIHRKSYVQKFFFPPDMI